MAAGIDIHNHIRTGSAGLEDVWQTKTYVHRQFAGIVGFIFTNAYLANSYFGDFKDENVKGVTGLHTAFKIKLANQLVIFKEVNNTLTRSSLLKSSDQFSVHRLLPLDSNGRKQLRCFYCKHARESRVRVKTTWYCQECGHSKPLCSPETGRDCFFKTH